MGILQQEARKAAEDAFAEADKKIFMIEESMMNDESNE